MFSKLPRLILSAALFAAGCGMPLGEKPATPKKPAVKLGFDSDCLKTVKPALGGWVEGVAPVEELDATWTCLENAVEIFKSKVVGSKVDEQSKAEVKKFFEDYVLKGTALTDGFMNEVMLLKRVLVGGDETKITRSELEKLKALMGLGRELTRATLPHMAVYTLKWTPGEDADANEAAFAKARGVLDASVGKLMAAIEANKHSYDLNRIPVLLEEIRKVAGVEWTWLPKVREYLPLVQKLKKSLVGGAENAIGGGEWRRFGSAAARGYAQLLRYEYFLKNEKELFAEKAKLGQLERLGDGVLELLAESVAQKPTAVLAKDELVELLASARTVFPSLKVSEGFVTELLALKESLFGGTADGMTASDLRNARGKLPQIRHLLEGVLKHKRYYLLSLEEFPNDRPEELAIADAQAAEKNLVTLGAQLAGLFVQPYDLNRLDALVREARASFGDGPGDGFNLAKYLPLLVSVKNLYFDDAGSIVGVGQYPGLLELATRAYSRYAEFHYFLKPIFDQEKYENLSVLEGRRSLGRMVNDGLALLQTFVNRRSPRLIPVDDVMKVWAAARKADILPDELTDATMKRTLEVLFRSVLLEPETRLKGIRPKGLTAYAFDYLRGEFGAWYASQALLETFWQQAGPKSDQKRMLGQWDAVLACLKVARGARLGCPEIVPADAQKYANVASLMKVSTEMRRMFTAPLPLSHATRRRLVIGNTFRDYNVRSLSYINLSRAIGRLLVQGYASKAGAPGSNIWLASRDDAGRAFADLKPIAVELGAIEEDNTSFATMRFLEANLFTPQGNGDAFLDLREGTGIVTYILSGLSHNSTIEERIRKEHCADKMIPDTRGVSKLDRVPVACLLHAYRVEMTTARTGEATLGVTLPNLTEYMLGLKTSVNGPGAVFDETKAQPYDLMMMDLMYASGWKNDGSKTAVMKDISLVVHVMQYIETVMQRFDGSVNGVKNGVLTRKEAMNGYPLFRGTVNDLLTKDETVAAIAEQMGDSLTKASYAYVLYHGGIPTCSTDKAELMKWALFPESQKALKSQRNKLAEILGILAIAARKKPEESLPSKCYYTVAP